jgi:hypothetical protein
MFKFPEALLAIFKGGKQYASVKVLLASREEPLYLPEEAFEHMGDYSEVPEPFALRTLFQ